MAGTGCQVGYRLLKRLCSCWQSPPRESRAPPPDPGSSPSLEDEDHHSDDLFHSSPEHEHFHEGSAPYYHGHQDTMNLRRDVDSLFRRIDEVRDNQGYVQMGTPHSGGAWRDPLADDDAWKDPMEQLSLRVEQCVTRQELQMEISKVDNEAQRANWLRAHRLSVTCIELYARASRSERPPSALELLEVLAETLRLEKARTTGRPWLSDDYQKLLAAPFSIPAFLQIPAATFGYLHPSSSDLFQVDENLPPTEPLDNDKRSSEAMESWIVGNEVAPPSWEEAMRQFADLHRSAPGPLALARALPDVPANAHFRAPQAPDNENGAVRVAALILNHRRLAEHSRPSPLRRPREAKAPSPAELSPADPEADQPNGSGGQLS